MKPKNNSKKSNAPNNIEVITKDFKIGYETYFVQQTGQIWWIVIPLEKNRLDMVDSHLLECPNSPNRLDLNYQQMLQVSYATCCNYPTYILLS